MAKIILEHVRKVYNGEVVAVDDMNLEIPDGEIVSLLGPSGCGKTTTMRLIAGFEDVDDGRILIDDQEVTVGLAVGRTAQLAEPGPNGDDQRLSAAERVGDVLPTAVA